MVPLQAAGNRTVGNPAGSLTDMTPGILAKPELSLLPVQHRSVFTCIDELKIHDKPKLKSHTSPDMMSSLTELPPPSPPPNLAVISIVSGGLRHTPRPLGSVSESG